MSGPVVSADTEAVYATLPELAQSLDAQQPAVPGVQPFGFPLLCWLEGLGSQLQAIDDLCRDTPEGPGYSQLLDVTRCPTDCLPWLAQFVGLRFNGIQQASDSLMRQAIENPGNWGRGTDDALLAAISPWLISTSGVVIEERAPDPYTVTVNVPHTDVVTLTYAQLSAEYATYAAVDAAFATYGSFPNNEAGVTAAAQAALPASLSLVVNFT